MKKILGVSFAAMLAVTPMMASADDLPTITLLGNPAGTVAAEANVATTSYVKGAYNDLAGKINTDRGAINANTGAIATLNGNAETAGSVDYKIAQASESLSGDISGKQDKSDSAVTAEALTQNGLTNGVDLAVGQGVGANLVAVAKKAKANAGAISAETTAREAADTALDGRITTNTGAIATLNGNAETAGSVDYKIAAASSTLSGSIANKQDKSDSEVTSAALTAAGLTAGTDLAVGQGVGANLVTVATKAKAAKDAADAAQADVDALETTVSGLSTGSATKEGVVATINHSTASGNVTVYTTWGNETTTGQDTITVSSTVTAPATNAYYATIGAQSGTTQTDSTPQNPGA